MHETVTIWIQKLREGDEVAAQKLWERYFEQLIRLARRKLLTHRRRVADEEDAVAAAFNSVYQGIEQGKFPRLNDRNDLWQLLIVVAERKLIDVVYRPEARQKRGGGKVRGDSIFHANDAEKQQGFEQFEGREPAPELVVQMLETQERLLNCLEDEEMRRVAIDKLEGFSNDEIAQRLGKTTRTIERKLNLIRSLWEKELSQ